MTKQLKILVSGDVEGNFNQLFKRVAAIQKKAGAFDMLFCVGSFFGDDNSEWEEYKTGKLKVPISTFVLGPLKTDHAEYFESEDGCDICDNVTFLGRKGVYTSSTGLQIAYLSGLDGSTSQSPDERTHFSKVDCDALRLPRESDTKFQGVDILLTSQWASGVERYGLPVEGLDSSQVGSQSISQLALCLRPRYHFSAKEGTHFERSPYRNHKVLQENARHVTRFIALAKVGNSQKRKYLYAFNIVPMKHMDAAELVKQAPDVTECPYKLESTEEASQKKEEKGAQFFYDQKALDRGHVGGKKRHQDRQGGPGPKKHAQPSGPCWFCLGSPEVEKHLVVSVGTQAYLALAKGGLTPEHVLITPIGHHQSVVSAPTDIIEEIEQYKTALKKCFKSHGKAMVFFERNYKTQHLQIQAVPVPQELTEDLKETFQGCALAQDIELHEIPKMSDLKQIVPAGAPYFHAELPSGDKLLYRIKKGFPLQFGREALAHDTLLNMPERIDWRNCKISKEEETTLTASFRDLFEEFDFTLA